VIPIMLMVGDEPADAVLVKLKLSGLVPVHD